MNSIILEANLSPFEIWLEEAEQHIILFVEALTRHGYAKNEGDALKILKELAAEFNHEDFVTSGDLWGNRGSRQLDTLRKALNNSASKKYTGKWRIYGVYGHRYVPEFLSKSACMPKSQNFPGERDLFQIEQTAITQATLFEMGEKIPQSLIENFECSKSVVRSVKNAWKSMQPVIEAKDFWAAWKKKQTKINHFYDAVAELFPIARAFKRGNPHDVFLGLLTLMTWLNAVKHLKPNRTLFIEIPVLSKRRYGLSGGRIDALEVRAVKSRPLKKSEQHLVRAISMERSKSVGHIIRKIRRLLGSDVEIAIMDWKFAVGDGELGLRGRTPTSWELIGKSPILDSEDIPLNSHIRQMERYLTLATLDTQHGTPKWEIPGLKLFGELNYLFPIKPPVIQRVDMDAEEKQRFFSEIKERWEPAKRRALTRQLTNFLVRETLGILNGQKSNDANGKNGNGNGNKNGNGKKIQPGLFAERKELDRLAQRKREFVDQYGCIIELVGKRKGDNRPIFKMYLHKLLEFIGNGQIETGRFDEIQGGKVRCIMPHHADPGNPSMHISPSRGIFKCFGCGLGGVLSLESVPKDLRSQITAEQFQYQGTASKSILAMTSEHVHIMQAAQMILSGQFKGSSGEQYLWSERKIDSDLAFAYGAGFARGDKLLNGLLDSGFTFEQLEEFGFISFSPNVTPLNQTVKLFQHRGMALDQMTRKIRFKTGPESALPFSTLDRRVTFPLELNEQINNFYARAIESRFGTIKHIKLSCKKTRIEHGGFNMKVLNNPGVTEVLIVEAVIDALSLILMGFSNVLAVIGVDNRTILEELLRSKKILGFALDNDKAGVDATNRIISEKIWPRFAERKSGEAYNFTALCVERHPEMIPYDDWNTWWVKEGHISFRKFF